MNGSASRHPQTFRHHARLPCILLTAAVCLTPAVAQQPDGDIRRVLGDLLDQLGEPTPERLISLSRLIPEPCDQVTWLRDRLEQLPADDLPDYAGPVGARLDALERGDWISGGCDGTLARARELLAEPSPQPETALAEITDPAALRSRWADEGSTWWSAASTTDANRFTLLARGVGPPAGWEDRAIPWDAPRRELLELLGESSAPDFYRMLGSLDDLETARQGAAAADPLVPATFDVARAALAYAMGMDGSDLGEPSWGAAHFQSLATRFAARDLWFWSATASRLGGAGATWDAYRTVAGNAPAWPVWLPTDAAFREAQRTQRARFEQEAAAADGRNDRDGLFRAMQQAKAAELGISASRTVGLSEMTETYLGGRLPWVYLFVEVLELRETQGGRFLGVGTRRTLYEDGNDEDRFEPCSGAGNSLDELVNGLIRANVANRRDLRILIALDGPPPAAWRAAESGLWSRHCEIGEVDAGWVAYLPSAATLVSPEWDEDAVLPAWCRLAIAEQRPLYTNSRPRSTSPRDFADLRTWPSEVVLFPMSIGDRRPSWRGGLEGLASGKRDSGSDLIPVFMRSR